MPPEFREWGDGATDRRTHVIEDISYSDDTILCRCGTVIHGIGDGSGWVDHGGSVLRMADAEERGAEPRQSSESAATRALASIAEQGKRCTCTPTSYVGLCPNFIDSDLEEELPLDPD